MIGDTFETCYFQSLAFLDYLDEYGGLGERIVGAGVEPCIAAFEFLHLQPAMCELLLIDRRYFEFSTGRGLDVFSNAYDVVGVEVKSYDGIVGFGVLRLLLY